MSKIHSFLYACRLLGVRLKILRIRLKIPRKRLKILRIPLDFLAQIYVHAQSFLFRQYSLNRPFLIKNSILRYLITC